jgi:subtilase-type serine protease
MLAALVLWPAANPAFAQERPNLDFVPLLNNGVEVSPTGIRGITITGTQTLSGGGTGGYIYDANTQTWIPFPVATSSGVNYPDATTTNPYGPSFGSYGGILRVIGTYKTEASGPDDLGYLYDAANAPSSRLQTLVVPNPPAQTVGFTIPHSTFGNQVVGDYSTNIQPGNAFIYDIPTGTYTTNNKPGALSTDAYGIWGDHIVGGYSEIGPGGSAAIGHGYLYSEATGEFTTYDHPGAVVTHFEGITGGGRANTYNIAATWLDAEGGSHASVLHIDAQGHENWVDIDVPGAALTTSNSIFEGTAVGIYIDSTGIHGYSLNIPGIYNPIRNTGQTTTTAGQ